MKAEIIKKLQDEINKYNGYIDLTEYRISVLMSETKKNEEKQKIDALKQLISEVEIQIQWLEYLPEPMQNDHPRVESINTYEVKDILKDCPKKVKDYVRSLESAYEKQTETLRKAILSIKELYKK